MIAGVCSKCAGPSLGRLCSKCAPVCADCGDPMCQAFRERILPGRSSYACALRVIDKLKARIAELEADPGRLTRCRDCNCEIMASAAFCQRCSGVDATDA